MENFRYIVIDHDAGCISSYTFTLHYQYEESLCHWCPDQKRRKPLTKDEIRANKLRQIGL